MISGVCESNEMRQAFGCKKEKFRIEIRRRNVASELLQRRIKLSEGSDSSSLQNIIRQQHFSGEEKLFDEELRGLRIKVNESLANLNFTVLHQHLIDLLLFLQSDSSQDSLSSSQLFVKIPKIISSGLLECFNTLLSDQFDQMPSLVNLVLEITCNLTLGSATQNSVIYESMLKHNLLKFLDFTLNYNIIDSVLHIIAHYFYDNTPPRNNLIKQNLISRIIEIYKKQRFGTYTKANKRYYITYTWCLSALIQDEKLITEGDISILNRISKELFSNVADEGSATNILWYFFRITQLEAQYSRRSLQVQLFDHQRDKKILEKLLSMLQFPPETCSQISLLTFKVISNIIECGDEQTLQFLVQNQMLDGFNYLSTQCARQPNTIAMVYWAVSNLLLVNSSIAEIVIHHQIFTNVLLSARVHLDQRQNESVTCICNAQQTANSFNTISYLQSLGCFEILINKLNDTSSETILIKAIDALTCALRTVGEESDNNQLDFLFYLDSIGLSERLDDLQNYPSEVVFEKAVDLIETFFTSKDRRQEEQSKTN